MQEELIKSNDLKNSIIELTLNKLGDCETFTKNVGSKRFIKKQLNKYLDTAYYGIISKNSHLGEYLMGNNEIVIYAMENKKKIM